MLCTNAIRQIALNTILRSRLGGGVTTVVVVIGLLLILTVLQRLRWPRPAACGAQRSLNKTRMPVIAECRRSKGHNAMRFLTLPAIGASRRRCELTRKLTLTYDFRLMFHSDSRSRWDRCRVCLIIYYLQAVEDTRPLCRTATHRRRRRRTPRSIV